MTNYQNWYVVAFILILCIVQLIIGKISLRKHPNTLMRSSLWMKLLS